jgi:hypothetical protein
VYHNKKGMIEFTLLQAMEMVFDVGKEKTGLVSNHY